MTEMEGVLSRYEFTPLSSLITKLITPESTIAMMMQHKIQTF